MPWEPPGVDVRERRHEITDGSPRRPTFTGAGGFTRRARPVPETGPGPIHPTSAVILYERPNAENGGRDGAPQPSPRAAVACLHVAGGTRRQILDHILVGSIAVARGCPSRYPVVALVALGVDRDGVYRAGIGARLRDAAAVLAPKVPGAARHRVPRRSAPAAAGSADRAGRARARRRRVLQLPYRALAARAAPARSPAHPWRPGPPCSGCSPPSPRLRAPRVVIAAEQLA